MNKNVGEKMNIDNNVIIYQDENGVTNVSVRFSDEDLWLTQNQMAEIYDTTQQNISQHIDNIYNDKELEKEVTNKKFLLVQTEGTRQVKRNIDHYNLDMMIALGYRIQSQIATRFRKWATVRLHEYIQKGFAMDDERLKQGGTRYFRELLQRIRDIRSSEIELQRLNLLVSQFLDFAEFQALEQNAMTMSDWIKELDNQILANKRKILVGKGSISHKQAMQKAEREFEIYRAREMKQLESDFDRAVKQIRASNEGEQW